MVHADSHFAATVMFGSGHPNDMDVTVGPNVRVNFSCTVNCSYPVDWYKAGHLYPIRTEYNDSRSIPGLQFRISNSTCTSEFKTTYFLEVLARRKFHKSVFYCAAYESCSSCQSTECKCGCDGMCFSRPWFLRGISVHVKFQRHLLIMHLFFNHIVNKMDAAVTTTLHPTPSSSQSLQGIVLFNTYLLCFDC